MTATPTAVQAEAESPGLDRSGAKFQRRRQATRRTVLLFVVLLAVVILLSVFVGSRMISPLILFDPSIPEYSIYAARISRTAVGLMVGASLALAGALLQGLTRNPLADPGILGINAGASFAMILAIAFVGISSLRGYLWFALVGTAVTMILVHVVAAIGKGGATPAKLVLAGAAVAAGLSSWSNAVLLHNPRVLDVFRSWQVGTIGGRGWDVFMICLPFFLVGGTLGIAGGPVLNTLALGDDMAKGLGRHTTRDRIMVGVAIVLLAGMATALAGPISFVGLVVPHAVRAMVGGDNTKVLPLSAGFGAILVTFADTVGRVIFPPTEVQVGIMTALIGIPAFVWFLRHGKMSGLYSSKRLRAKGARPLAGATPDFSTPESRLAYHREWHGARHGWAHYLSPGQRAAAKQRHHDWLAALTPGEREAFLAGRPPFDRPRGGWRAPHEHDADGRVRPPGRRGGWRSGRGRRTEFHGFSVQPLDDVPAPTTVDIDELIGDIKPLRAKVKAARRIPYRHLGIMVAALGAATVALFFVRCLLGDFTISFPDFFAILGGEQIRGATFILMQSKLPRAILAILVGVAFGTAGATFQQVLRNPLASPDILGISTGASTAAVFGITVLHWSGMSLNIMGLIGAIVVALFIRVAAGSDNPFRLVLVGVVVASALVAFIQYLFNRASNNDAQLALRWFTGSLNRVDWPTILILAILLAILIPITATASRAQKVVELGSDAATALGIGPRRTDLMLLLAVLLTAFGVAAAGPVLFVAFVSGPIARALNQGRSTLLGAALVGGIIVLAADFVAAYAIPNINLPVGVVTGAFGAPFMLWLLARRTGRKNA
jgi:iron complex transport system permease protein